VLAWQIKRTEGFTKVWEEDAQVGCLSYGVVIVNQTVVDVDLVHWG
jgi:hypothetical protein